MEGKADATSAEEKENMDVREHQVVLNVMVCLFIILYALYILVLLYCGNCNLR